MHSTGVNIEMCFSLWHSVHRKRSLIVWSSKTSQRAHFGSRFSSTSASGCPFWKCLRGLWRGPLSVAQPTPWQRIMLFSPRHSLHLICSLGWQRSQRSRMSSVKSSRSRILWQESQNICCDDGNSSSPNFSSLASSSASRHAGDRQQYQASPTRDGALSLTCSCANGC